MYNGYKEVDDSYCFNRVNNNTSNKPNDTIEACTATEREATDETEGGRDGHRCGEWRTTAWGACTATCGRGIRVRVVYCSNGDAGCVAATKPPNTDECYVTPCLNMWQVGEWSEV